MKHTWVFLALILLGACGGPEQESWHTVELSGEFSADRAAEVDSFEAYLELEDRLFAEMDSEIYAHTDTGSAYRLFRYSSGSAADPRQHQPNWNRSFELKVDEPVGGVLLLHGMSDSPYSLRALGETLHKQGYQVLGIRLPGHGTIPSGLKSIRWQDMAAAVNLAMRHLSVQVGDKPVHVIGYSTGAPLALDFALKVEQGEAAPMPASLVLISPAIGLSPAAALAGWNRRLSMLPGASRLAWLSVEPEFDPYKYNSFATNAAEQVYKLTRSVSSRLEARKKAGINRPLPPILAVQSAVDATVSTDAVVDRLLTQLHPDQHELLLFDINRLAVTAPLLVSGAAPLASRLGAEPSLPYSLTLVHNASVEGGEVISSYREASSTGASDDQALPMPWPRGILSLSHVAMPISPGDPLYGQHPPENRQQLFLGRIPVQGERGLLIMSSDWLLRLRFNPFYDYMEQRVLDWLQRSES